MKLNNNIAPTVLKHDFGNASSVDKSFESKREAVLSEWTKFNNYVRNTSTTSGGLAACDAFF